MAITVTPVLGPASVNQATYLASLRAPVQPAEVNEMREDSVQRIANDNNGVSANTLVTDYFNRSFAQQLTDLINDNLFGSNNNDASALTDLDTALSLDSVVLLQQAPELLEQDVLFESNFTVSNDIYNFIINALQGGANGASAPERRTDLEV